MYLGECAESVGEITHKGRTAAADRCCRVEHIFVAHSQGRAYRRQNLVHALQSLRRDARRCVEHGHSAADFGGSVGNRPHNLIAAEGVRDGCNANAGHDRDYRSVLGNAAPLAGDEIGENLRRDCNDDHVALQHVQVRRRVEPELGLQPASPRLVPLDDKKFALWSRFAQAADDRKPHMARTDNHIAIKLWHHFIPKN